MLLLTLDQLQHNSGLGSFLLEEPDVPAPHLEGFWIKQICTFLKQIDGSLQIADLTIQPLQHERDYYIMDAAVSLPDFSPAAICQINYCRLYLQILTISDMTNATGTRLAPGCGASAMELISGVKASPNFKKSIKNVPTKPLGLFGVVFSIIYRIFMGICSHPWALGFSALTDSVAYGHFSYLRPVTSFMYALVMNIKSTCVPESEYILSK
jgi:hypothetical protein